MAGTDRSKTALAAAGKGPTVVLVRPQLGDNIGMAARAMLNCALAELRLVSPRDGWPNAKARDAASGADAVIDAVAVYSTTEEAIADCTRVYAASARPRGMIKPVLTPRRAALEMRADVGSGARVAILFGGERSGLDNADMTLADTVIEAPLNPGFRSLNLAHAVMLVSYEWYCAALEGADERLEQGRTRAATKSELLNFFRRLEAALDAGGFLFPPEKRPTMVRNIRNLFQRARLTEQEVRTLHGIVSCLTRGRAGDN